MKKVFSLMLVICLLLTSAAPVFAAEDDSKSLEKAILAVKKVVTIPGDYKVFQYSSSEYEYDNSQSSTWYLNWNTEDGGAGLSATVDMEGQLLSYYSYDDKEKSGLGSVSREEGIKAAKNFMSKAVPELSNDMELIESTDNSNTYRHYYNYKLNKNQISVSFAQVRIEVDKHSGKVVSYNGVWNYSLLDKLPSKENIIGTEEGIKAYLEQIGIKLSYYSHFDYKAKKLTVFPAYSADGLGSKAIDAKTGNVVGIYYDDMLYTNGGMGSANKESSDAVRDELTKEELDALERISGLITKGKAESILRNLVPGISSDMKVTNTSLSRNYMDNSKFNWEIGFDGAYGIVDAKTGELMSFYIYKEDSTKGSLNLSRDKAQEKGEAFLKQISPESYKEVIYNENGSYPGLFRDDSNAIDYSFNYSRQVNGISFNDNGFNVTVNKASGTVTQYNKTWYDNVEFPAIDNVITQEEAFNVIDKSGNLGLHYKRTSPKEVVIVYDFEKAVNFMVNPINGERIGWDGKAYKEGAVSAYTDLKGHWSESIVNKLLDNGYYLEGDKFNPNNKITQISFLRYLYSPSQSYYNDEDFYKMLIADKVIKEGEKNPKGELTRQDAAKFTVRFLGQGKSAEHPEIFINPFKDTVTASYKGYAAISYGLGIMKGDLKGRFNGTKIMTNAEAAVAIYNGLQAK